MSLDSAFDYAEFVDRNLGFVNANEQRKLREGRVLVIGVGGMGGAAVQALARLGLGALTLADIDAFELSNLNRQVFANIDTIGSDKAQATASALQRINPQLHLQVLGREWPQQLDVLLNRHHIVINGMDDIAMGVHLYRRAAVHGATVIDAYTSPLPSVITVSPQDPRPEQRLGYPSLGVNPAQFTPELLQACFGCELEYVMVHSSSANHIDLELGRELMAGTRKRMSFAPMVITTGNMMAFEVVKCLLGRTPMADARGYFFNPWTMQVERPHSKPVAALRRFMVRRFMARLMRG
jgi:hypothetical protein